jgi:hypothetical protein
MVEIASRELGGRRRRILGPGLLFRPPAEIEQDTERGGEGSAIEPTGGRGILERDAEARPAAGECAQSETEPRLVEGFRPAIAGDVQESEPLEESAAGDELPMGRLVPVEHWQEGLELRDDRALGAVERGLLARGT